MPAPAAREQRDQFRGRSFDERDAAPDAYRALFERFDEGALRREADRVGVALGELGTSFGDGEFLVDVIPRLLTAAEWDRLAVGIVQRVRALSSFAADAYGDRRAVAAGIVPERVIDSADWYEPAVAGLGGAITATIAGPDLIRAPDGRFLVVEDNLRAPSGLAYLIAARRCLEPLAAEAGLRPRSLEPAIAAFRAAIAAAAPPGGSGARGVLINDGPGSIAAWEHELLAGRAGMTVATTAELRCRDGGLLLGDAPVDVIYRRVDDERLTGSDGRPTALGELLVEPLRSGRLGCVNFPGTGIADDKAVHVYVERMVEFYLGEEPLLASVAGFDLGDPEQLAAAEPRLDELVIKPRSEFGGRGVTIGPLADPAERRAAVAAVRRDPGRWVAQEPVALSVHPTLTEDGIAGRHVDLRPFAISAGESVTVAAGGLTRFATERDSMIVNSGRGGGAKDTWVL